MKCRACSMKRSSFAIFITGSLFEIEYRQVIKSRFDDSNNRQSLGSRLDEKEYSCCSHNELRHKQKESDLLSTIISHNEFYHK